MSELLREMTMHALPLVFLLFLCACAPTMDDLILEANLSGDWTAVNSRIARDVENEIESQECRSDTVRFCENSLTAASCTCVPEYHFDDRQRELAIRRRFDRRH
jgi:hypothetical protein